MNDLPMPPFACRTKWIVLCMRTSLEKFRDAARVVLESRRPPDSLFSGSGPGSSGRRRRRSLRFWPLRLRPLSPIAAEIREVRVLEEIEPLGFQGGKDVRVT